MQSLARVQGIAPQWLPMTFLGQAGTGFGTLRLGSGLLATAGSGAYVDSALCYYANCKEAFILIRRNEKNVRMEARLIHRYYLVSLVSIAGRHCVFFRYGIGSIGAGFQTSHWSRPFDSMDVEPTGTL